MEGLLEVDDERVEVEVDVDVELVEVAVVVVVGDVGSSWARLPVGSLAVVLV